MRKMSCSRRCGNCAAILSTKFSTSAWSWPRTRPTRSLGNVWSTPTMAAENSAYLRVIWNGISALLIVQPLERIKIQERQLLFNNKKYLKNPVNGHVYHNYINPLGPRPAAALSPWNPMQREVTVKHLQSSRYQAVWGHAVRKKSRQWRVVWHKELQDVLT